MNRIKRFFKEIKRVRWPSGKESNKAFWISLIFIIVAAIILFAVAIALTELWQSTGIGV